MATLLIDHLKLRHGSAAYWTAANPVLMEGELAYESDTHQIKIGDGTTAYADLPYGGIQGPEGPQGVAGLQGPQGPTNIPPSGAISSVYTLTIADVGEFVEISAGGSVVIPNATFAAGDVITVFNNTTQTSTMTCSVSTAYIAGVSTSRATVSILTRGLATVLFVNSTTAVISGAVI